MNPVDATALYVSATRAVLQCDPLNPHTFTEMYKQLPFFRQSLACVVCGKLLEDPISPTHPECQHYVCLGCKGQKMQMRSSCSRCKDYSCFQENKQLSLLVQCYRQLCLYVTHSPLLQSISSHVGGSPEVMALLEEVLMSHKEETEHQESAEEDVGQSAPESLTPTEAPPAPAELSAIPQSSSSEPLCFNGPLDCNGEALEDPSSPELEVCEVVEEQQHLGLSVSETTGNGFELGLSTAPLTPTIGTVCSLREGEPNTREVEEGEVLLLSVEEVLQTLDPLQPDRDTLHVNPDRTHIATDKTHTHMYIQLDAAHNYTQIHTGRTHMAAHRAGHTHSSAFEPPPASKPPQARPTRKRSRSESDREKVNPVPITSILQDSSPQLLTPSPSHMLHTKLPMASLTVPAHTYSSVPNGAFPKHSRPTQNHNKGARKHVDPNSKKAHTKARSTGGSKTKDRSKDQRPMPGCVLPTPPVRPAYKKPVEKKGCKCGRATQNPSVLTCRGQRCPCYSNRKACLDCICRGCQNSYMANGEKKLEAFAVPEKALEQTRLTLGINLTSITAAAALRNPATTSIRTNTLLNVATATGTPVTTAFLSATPPQDPNFDDSLELLIG
ncbi:PREDICTED: E3 ubiquitin-protein ligase MSL2 [Cyprinodon variegatus]|uniref:E3 ubiquitin-protein ligase MSL2 n=1 Tax=Cyprinodon variegatus TaxID=28743 RepID=A0A3Q2GNX1_CYPVA|nr:PREDICTED: E3 ubiquitin-protein ligase MSL2 [Cyprinodon variegatus]